MSDDIRPEEISDEDKLWSSIGYPIPFIAILALLIQEKKERPYVRYHATQAIAFNVALWGLILIASVATFGIGAICSPLIWLISLWPAYDAYRGNYTELPLITGFIKKRGWVS